MKLNNLLEYFKFLKKMSNITQIYISEENLSLSEELNYNSNKIKDLYPCPIKFLPCP